MAAKHPSTLQLRMEDWLFRLVVGTLRFLPYSRRLRVMAWLCRRVIGPIAGYKSRADANLKMIYPEMPATRRKEIVDGVLDGFGRTLIENYSRPEFRARIKTMTPKGPGLQQALDALKTGRGVIFSSGHYSNHEAARVALDELGFKVGGLYRPMKNPFVNTHYVESITDVSGPVFAQGKDGLKAFYDFLQNGGHGFLLHDVHFGRGEPFPFLGRPAMTAFSAAIIAKRFDTLLVPYFVTRQADGESFDIEFEEPIPHGETEAMMRDLVDRLERRVEANPTQWLWFHRRWKI